MIITHDGVPFEVRVDGPQNGRVLLLSNSLSCDLSMWDGQIHRWAKRFKVVRFDQRGHGATPPSPGPYTIHRLASDALAVLDGIGVERASFCGLSLGGMVGMALLCLAPHRIGRAVLANTSAHMGPRSLWDGRIELVRAGGIEASVEPTLKRWFPAAFHERAPATIERMREMVRRTSAVGYVACCEAIRDMDQRESIRLIANPVLVIIGANDPATTPEAGRQIHDAICGSKIEMLNAAHISAVEQPEAFAQAVEEFLFEA